MDRTAITSRWIVCVVAVCSLAGISRGVEFADGTGEPNDPYQIATAEQLIGISSDPSLFDRHFVLTADIDLDPSLPGRKIFRQPVVDWPVSRPHATRRAVGMQDISTLASVQDGSFHGSFDGGGHVVRNCMLINASGTLYPGFFGLIASEAVVRNLHIEDMTVADLGRTSNLYPGLLAAVNQGMVMDCSVTGTLTTYSGGGFIGRNTGLVVGCRASCEVFGGLVGGFIGQNETGGRVLQCEFDGVLYGDSLVGGLAGTNQGMIQYCKSAGLILANGAGGLAGLNTGTVRESCTIATMESGGGVAYRNEGTITNCYSTGEILGTPRDGMVVANTGTIQFSYSATASQVRPARTPVARRSPLGSEAATSGDDAASRELAAQDDATISALAETVFQCVYYLLSSKTEDSIENPYDGYGVPLSPAQMIQKSSFIGFDFHGDASDGPADHWFMPPEGYPVLTWQTEITGLVGVPDVSGLSLEQARMVLEAAGVWPNGIRYDYARPPDVRTETKGQVIMAHPVGYLSPGSPAELVVSLGKYDFTKNPGDGSEENPYQIATAGQLDALCDQSALWGKHFELTADIDLSGYVYTGSLIGGFSGDFNGNGHAIRNFRSDRGLFDAILLSASVHDLIVDRAYVLQVSSSGTGILAARNAGQILLCQVTGQIVGGGSEIGGLVGFNTGRLTECCFKGRIESSGGSYVGGLVGMNLGRLHRCCTRDVGILGGTYGTYVGGLVGMNLDTISRCCARDVDVSAGNYVGGLVGENGSTTACIRSCYATGTVRGRGSVGGLLGHHGGGTGTRRWGSTQDQITVADEPAAGVAVLDCYAACSVAGQSGVGGCIGSFKVPGIEQQSCFFLAPQDGGGPDNGLGTPLTDAQMKQQASFAGWDFVDTWTICEGVDYPRLWWEGVDCGDALQVEGK